MTFQSKAFVILAGGSACTLQENSHERGEILEGGKSAPKLSLFLCLFTYYFPVLRERCCVEINNNFCRMCYLVDLKTCFKCDWNQCTTMYFKFVCLPKAEFCLVWDFSRLEDWGQQQQQQVEWQFSWLFFRYFSSRFFEQSSLLFPGIHCLLNLEHASRPIYILFMKVIKQGEHRSFKQRDNFNCRVIIKLQKAFIKDPFHKTFFFSIQHFFFSSCKWDFWDKKVMTWKKQDFVTMFLAGDYSYYSNMRKYEKA